MFSLKRTALFVTVLATFFCMLNPAMAADLSVKANSTKAGVSHVQVPYISGAVGGKQVDAAVNRAVFSYVNAQLKQLLSAEEVKTFDSMHQDNGESDNMLHYNADLVKYTDKKLTAKSENGRITASWYVQSAYEVKTAKDTFYSVILKTKSYTGGPGNVMEWKALNFDLRDGRLLELKDLFAAEADYATRLQTLIGYQQKGRARLLRHVKGKTVADPKPVTITGQESFYVDDHYNLGVIIYSSKKNASVDAGNATEADTADAGAKTMEVFDISLNDFADLIKL